MKFNCATENFSKAASLASISVPTSGITELASVVLIRAEGEKVSLSSMNSETNTSVVLGANVSKEGSICLPANVFADMIKRFSGDDISFESDGSFLVTMKSGRTKCEIAGADPKDFPEAPNFKSEKEIKISEKVFGDMIRGTAFAASTNEQRPTIMGCLLEITKDVTRMVAIDGYRIAVVEVSKAAKGEGKVNIPATALKDWGKISEGSDEEIAIKIGEKNITIEKNTEEMEIKFTSRVISGEFMDWQKFIPAEFKNEIVLEKSDMTRAIERVSTVLTAAQKAPIKLTFSKEGVDFYCETTVGKANDDIDKQSNLPEQVMGFNNRFLYEAVKNADSDEIKLMFNGPTDALMLANPEAGEKNYKYMVLPVRL